MQSSICPKCANIAFTSSSVNLLFSIPTNNFRSETKNFAQVRKQLQIISYWNKRRIRIGKRGDSPFSSNPPLPCYPELRTQLQPFERNSTSSDQTISSHRWCSLFCHVTVTTQQGLRQNVSFRSFEDSRFSIRSFHSVENPLYDLVYGSSSIVRLCATRKLRQQTLTKPLS